MTTRQYRKHRDTLVWGLILIAVGVTFMLMNAGVWPNDTLRHWWPLLVVIAGVGSLGSARGPKGVGSAVTTAAMGAWLLVATNGWYDLGWSRSWPLVFVAMGLGTLTEAIVAQFWRDSEEESHGC
jgi:cell wall-active antibiotic response 4TMS protein YvqF